MKILDRIALNRTFIIIGNFIMSLIKLFTNQKIKNPNTPKLPDTPIKPPKFPWIRNILNRNKNNNN